MIINGRDVRPLNGHSKQMSLVHVDEVIGVLQQRQHVCTQVRNQRSCIQLGLDTAPQLVLSMLDGFRLLDILHERFGRNS